MFWNQAHNHISSVVFLAFGPSVGVSDVQGGCAHGPASATPYHHLPASELSNLGQS